VTGDASGKMPPCTSGARSPAFGPRDRDSDGAEAEEETPVGTRPTGVMIHQKSPAVRELLQGDDQVHQQAVELEG